MPRVKRSVHARKKRRKVLEQARGYFGIKKSSYKYAKEQVDHSLVYAYRDRRAPGGSLVQPVHLRLQEGEHRARSQSPGGSSGQGAGGLQSHRRAGEGRALELSTSDRQVKIFLGQVAACRAPAARVGFPDDV